MRFLGRPSDEDFLGLIDAVDLGVSLRRPPTNGETSGALLHLLRSGVPTIVSDTGSVAVPAQVIERPVLLLRGASATPAPFGVIEQLMWRLRVAGNETWVLATALSQSETMNRAQALEAARVRAQFLRGLFAG